VLFGELAGCGDGRVGLSWKYTGGCKRRLIRDRCGDILTVGPNELVTNNHSAVLNSRCGSGA